MIAAVAGSLPVGSSDSVVIGAVRGQARERGGHRHRRLPAAWRRRAGSGGPVGRCRPVFELAFAEGRAVGVDGGVQAHRGLRDRRGGFGGDRRRVAERRERLIAAYAGAARVHYRDPEVVDGARGKPRDQSRYGHGIRSRARQRRARRTRPIGDRRTIFELAFAHFSAVGIHGGAKRHFGLRDRACTLGDRRRRRHFRGAVQATQSAGPIVAGPRFAEVIATVSIGSGHDVVEAPDFVGSLQVEALGAIE